MIVHGRTLHPGSATGLPIRLTAPLSFWGGTDNLGRIVDAHHPQCGAVLTGRILLMESGRGSSSASSVLAEQIRVVKQANYRNTTSLVKQFTLGSGVSISHRDFGFKRIA